MMTVVVSVYIFHGPPAYQRKDDARVSQDNAFQSHSESTIRQLSFILGSFAAFEIVFCVCLTAYMLPAFACYLFFLNDLII